MKISKFLLPSFMIMGWLGFQFLNTLSAQVSITTIGQNYSQDFNTLANTGTSSVVPTNWAFLEAGTPNGNTIYTAGTGSGNAGDTYSFGPTSNTDRAFGSVYSSTNSILYTGVSFTNNTLSTLTQLNISFTGEQWRCGLVNRPNPDTLQFSYSLNATTLGNGTWNIVPQLNFVTPPANWGPLSTTVVGALVGNNAANKTAVSYTISGLSILPSQTWWIRWQDKDIPGSDDGLSIDDLTVIPCVTGIPQFSANQTICNGTATQLSVALSGSINPSWSFTWTDGTTPTQVTGLTTSPYVFSITPTSTTTYSITGGTDGCGAIQPGTSSIVSVVNNPLSASLSGNQTICNTLSATHTLQLNGNAPWQFTWTDGTTPTTITGYTSSTYLFTVTPTQTTTYSITALSDLCGIGSPGQTSVITVNPASPPTAVLGGNQTICTGSSASMSVLFTGGPNWDITYTDGTTPVSITGIILNPYNLVLTPSAATTYTLTNVSSSICIGSASGTADVGLRALPTAIITGTNTLCAGQTATLSVSLTGSNPWDITYTDGITPTTVTGITSSPYVFTTTPSSNTTYTVSSYLDLFCNGNTTPAQVVTVNALPTASLAGSQTICNGNGAQLTATLTGSSPWSVTWTNGTTPQTATGITSSPYWFTVSPSQSTTYSLTAISNVCSGTISVPQQAAVTVLTAPTAVFSGAQSICSGGSTQLSIQLTGLSPYQLTWTDGTTPTSVTGITSSPYVINVTPAQSITYQITQLSDGGICGGITGSTHALQVNPIPTATLSASSSTICQGSGTQLSITLTGSQPWQITFTDGTSSVNQSGITSSPYFISLSPSSSSTYTLSAVSGLGCSGSASGTHITNVQPIPTATFTGSQSICSGNSTQLTTQLGQGSVWSITWSDGTTNTQVTGITASPYLISVTPTQARTYTLVTVSNGNCTSSPGTQVSVGFNTLPTVVWNAPAAVCAGSALQLSATLQGQAPWTLAFTNGVTTTTVTGITSSPYVATVSPTVQTTYQTTQFSDAVCTGSNGSQVVVSPLTVPQALLGEDQTICAGDNVQLTIDLTGNSPWSVDYSDGAQTYTLSGISATPWTVDLAPGITTTYNLVSVVGQCTGTVDLTPVIIQVNPGVQALLSSNVQVCTGFGALLTVQLNQGMAPYAFSYSDGTNLTQVTGINSNPYLLSVTPAQTTTYSLFSASDASVCSGTATGQGVVTVLPSPGATISPSTATLCTGSAVNLTVNFTGTAPWDVTYSDGTFSGSVTGITSNPYIVSITPITSGTWDVTQLYASGCAGVSNGPATLTVNPTPMPVITGTQTLVANGITGTASYQWLLNGTPISGATQSTWVPVVNGTYSVQVIQNGCTGMSGPYAVTTISVSPLLTEQLSFWPNPSTGVLVLPDAAETSVTEVLQADGKLVGRFRGGETNLNHLPAGIYFLHHTTIEGKVSVGKWVLQP
jgi:hypothetical protein